VADPIANLRRDYAPPLLAYLARQDERGLHAAYELGRQAIEHGIGLLDLVTAHNEVYLDVASTARDAEEAHDLARAASAFLFEALAAFEMTQRGFMAGDGLAPRLPRSRP
jgi:hypothetical protein